MAKRSIEKTRSFARKLEQLSRTHRGLELTVDEALEDFAAHGPSRTSDQIPGLNGLPVFKVRLRLPGVGKSGGARLIYHCDPECVTAMFLYAKGQQENASTKEIQDALKAAGLLGGASSEPSEGRPA